MAKKYQKWRTVEVEGERRAAQYAASLVIASKEFGCVRGEDGLWLFSVWDTPETPAPGEEARDD